MKIYIIYYSSSNFFLFQTFADAKDYKNNVIRIRYIYIHYMVISNDLHFCRHRLCISGRVNDLTIFISYYSDTVGALYYYCV